LLSLEAIQTLPLEGGRGRGFQIPSSSGPRVARAFGIAFGAVCLWAFFDLLIQAPELVASRGLLPIAGELERLRAADAGFFSAPSLFWISDADAFIYAVLIAGMLASVAVIAGVFPRIASALIAVLYLSLVNASGAFLAFQWDVMLIECAVLASLLPRDRPAAIAHWLLRLLLFKLYLESGIAKLSSPLGDWIDGSAMTFYYETSPLPGPLSWYAHHLADGWHAFEGWLVAGLELGGALLILGPRKARLAALIGFTGFQLVNLATSNYGFFVYLTLALHIFLLDERDVERLGARLGDRINSAVARWRELRPTLTLAIRPVFRRRLLAGFAALWLALSTAEALAHFAKAPLPAPLRDTYRWTRAFNVYYLFTAITRQRIEVALETFDGTEWTRHQLRHKPGALGERPPLVAPHQPRVAFRIWFYALGNPARPPRFVRNLVDRACRDPAAIEPLFAGPLPPSPQAVRLSRSRYRFTTPSERDETGKWWKSQELAPAAARGCP
jgi:uncharacterized membrane protein YphA (DoxX/SURF4 family)